MPEPNEAKPRWRRPLVYTIALVLAVAVGAATVFFLGSSNRRSDRAAVVSYERAFLPAVREAGRIVQQEMKPSLAEIDEGKITNEQLLERADAWQRVFEKSRADLLALTPPPFLGDIEQGWSTAMGGYLLAVDAFRSVARAEADARENAIDQAATFGERADALFDSVAGIIQFHRRRLGLGATPNLPDASPTPTS
jgi:hypothetical protein